MPLSYLQSHASIDYIGDIIMRIM